MSLLLALAAAAAAQAPATAPRGLSLREAQTLPASALRERVLGATGALYPEIVRPDPAITRGRAFDLVFAAPPRSAGYPGLCEAETIRVNFGPAGDGPATATGQVQSVERRRVYRMVGDPAVPSDRQIDSYWRGLREQCAAAGPVLSRPSPSAPGFFGGSYYSGGDFRASHAWFGALALARLSTAAASGSLPPVTCQDDARPDNRICATSSALLRNLPMERFVGFWIERCAPEAPDLCVTANFAGERDSGPSTITVRMRTGLTEVLYPPLDFTLREIRIEAFTPVS